MGKAGGICMNEGKQIVSGSKRWDPYFLISASKLEEFIAEHFEQPRRILFILGRGFDPRMCDGIKILSDHIGKATITCYLVNFIEGTDSPSQAYRDRVEENLQKLRSLTVTHKIVEKKIRMWKESGLRRRRVSSRSATDVIENLDELLEFDDIFVDVSAMPRSVFFSITGKILKLLDGCKDGRRTPNFFSIISESPGIDARINDASIDDSANYLQGFGSIELEGNKNVPKIWIPVVGGLQRKQLDLIYELVGPDEIFPVLPFPAKNPRKSDELLIEYRELFFDDWGIEPGNIIYASEGNPFDVYRQILKTTKYYNKVLYPLGGCKTIVSAMSSKLLSIGALLAAYELKSSDHLVAVANVESLGYNVKTEKIEDDDRTLNLALLFNGNVV
jgi:hypothetical protein